MHIYKIMRNLEVNTVHIYLITAQQIGNQPINFEYCTLCIKSIYVIQVKTLTISVP